MKARVTLAVFIALITGVCAAGHLHISKNSRWDFETFYLVAKILRDGQGARLYDLPTQASYQMRYIDASRAVVQPDLPFFYPAATATLFVPLSFLPVLPAYAVWTALNVAFLIGTVRLLQKRLKIPGDDRVVFASLLFLPVYIVLLHGQVSILILCLYAVAFELSKRERRFAAGVALGLGTLKFQLMLGIFVVLVLRRCWRILAGAMVGALAVALLSAAVLGWRGAIHYPAMLVHNAHLPTFDTPGMINLRGLLTTVLSARPATWLVIALSGAVLGFVAFVRADLEISFCAAIVGSLLVSYHSFSQELTLLLIPLAVVVSRLDRVEAQRRFIVLALASEFLLYPWSAQGAAVMEFVVIGSGLWFVGRRPRESAAA
jgi:hypothetical protein